MRKNSIHSFFLFIILIFLFLPLTPFSLFQVQGAKEAENVDTFDVMPDHRWEITENGFDHSLEGVGLRINGTGTVPGTLYRMVRNLRDLDGKIVIRFRYNVSTNLTSTDIQFGLTCYGGYSAWILELGHYVGGGKFYDGSYANTSLTYPTEGTDPRLWMDKASCLYEGYWYKATFKYDHLETGYSCKVTFDNGTIVFDKDWHDVSNLDPDFLDPNPEVCVAVGTKDVGDEVFVWIDYIKAPFQERTWTHYDECSDSDWLYSSFSGHEMQDDLGNETDGYRLTVPYLDSYSGELHIDAHSSSYFAGPLDPDQIRYYMRLYTVGADDGELTEAIEVRLSIAVTGTGGDAASTLRIELDDTYVESENLKNTGANKAWCKFAVTLTNDRSRAELKVQGKANTDSYDDVHNFIVEFNDVDTDYSTEFVIEISAFANLRGVNQNPWLSVESFDFLERDWFEELHRFLVWFGTEVYNIAPGFFAALFRGIASVFAFVGDLIVAAVEALEPVIDLVTAAVEAMEGVLEEAIGLVQDAVAAVADDILDLVGDFIDDAIAWCLDILADIFGLFAALIFWGWDFLWETVFGMSEAPDLLAIMYVLAKTAVEIAIGFPQFVTDFFNIFFFWGIWLLVGLLGLIVIGGALEAQNKGTGGLGWFYEMFTIASKDVFGGHFGIFGNHIPVPLGLVLFPLIGFVILGVW